MKIEHIEEHEVKIENLPQIVDRIFAICKNDKSFKSKSKIEAVDAVIDKLNEKIKKQKALLKRAGEMEKETAKRLETLKNANHELRSSLLERLGSTL